MTNTNSNETFSITIELPKAWEVQSRGQVVTLDVSAFGKDIIAKAVTHGLTQKVSDSAASAAKSACLGSVGNDEFKKLAVVKAWTTDENNFPLIQQEALHMMEATCARLADGDWGVERSGGGAGVDPVSKKARELARPMYKGTLNAADTKAFNGYNAASQYAAIDGYIEAAKAQGIDLRAMAQSIVDAAKAITVDVTGL